MLLLCRITIIILHNVIRFIHIDLNPTPSIVNSVEGIVVYNNLHDMAVRLKYADLTYVKQPDARPLDLTSFREAGAAITAAADNLQERAIRNENAYNEMAIKMSEYNAIKGADEEALAGKINETQEHIKAKVDEDGGWFFADTAVSDGARKFLTNEGVKTILSNKAQFDALMQQNEASDAPEEYKAANRAMILEKFNKAGGSLGGNGKQSITAFGTALGKGHDRSVYQKELLEMMKAWKADKRSVFNAEFIKDATDLMNIPGTSEQVQATVQKIIADRGGNLSGVLTRDSTIESVTEDEIREVFTAVLSAKPEFRTAMAKEAEIDKWLNSKQGGTNSSLVTNALKQYVDTDPKMQQSMLSSSDFTKLTKKQQAIALQDPAVIQKYIDQGMANSMSDLQQQPNESDEAYQARMGATYNKIYTEQNISSLLNMAKIGAYTAVENKTDVKWFDNLLIDSLKAKREQLEKIKGQMTESIGFTRANLPANAMMNIVDANIKTATEALDNAKATMAKYENAKDDQSRYLYQQAEKSYIDAQNIIQQNNAILNSVYRQFDLNNPEDKADVIETANAILSNIGGFAKDFGFTNDVGEPIKKKVTEAINHGANTGEVVKIISDELVNLYDSNPDAYMRVNGELIGTDTTLPFGLGGNDYRDNGKKHIEDIVRRSFLELAESKGYKPQTTPITLFTPISNNKAAFSDALDGVARLLEDNAGIWNFATASLGDDPENAKFLEKVIGMPLTSSEDFKDIFSSRKSGSGNNAVYQMSARNLSIGSDATGRLYLKVTIPAQGDNQVPREAILYTDDDGANMALRDAMRKGAQCSYNQAMTNPYDAYQRQTANEIMAFSGNIEQLGADLSRITNPQERSLNRFNTINGQRVSNVSQALDIITNDKRIYSLGNYYPLTSTDFKYNITKHPSGTYSVNVQKYNPKTNSYSNMKENLNYSFEDDIALRNNLPALIYKLNHGNELKANFIPTQYLTPQQRSAYDVSYWSNDSLMLR